MQDFELPGKFYLGKNYVVESRTRGSDLVLYDSRDLTTHAVCVGMTGSGKSGLCLALLEEAAIDGIPAIVIDPKGDLGNLLLTFPNLAPVDFRPWVDPGDAERRKISVDQLAEQTAQEWRTGLADWGEDAARITRFRDAADAAIYTPGGSHGLPLTVLRSFTVPPAAILENGDALRERIGAAVSGLLVLLGIDADPLRSREHILLANILESAWRSGRDVSLADLIRSIQAPPFEKIGVIDLETIFPAKDRFELSMRLNNLMASPGFSAWMEGAPLDINSLLYASAGKPRLSIISIAHLSDAERMFFVTILLNEVIAWMRQQSGTSSLRALLYMDEVFGYFPPTANPPTKTPMLTLLKQARAYGLGIVLATQNPVDLDYKGLANAGTWFIGRMQTERDKARVLDGLEGASSAAGAAFDRQKMDSLISGLGKRVFLMNNVHDDVPIVFQTRWALSYLRGPLSREQIQALMAKRKDVAKPQASGDGLSTAASVEVATASAQSSTQAPVLPPEIPQFFVPVRQMRAAGTTLVYQPGLYGTARVHFVQSKTKIDVWETRSLLAPLAQSSLDEIWDRAKDVRDEPPELEKSSDVEKCGFGPVPAELTRPKKFAKLTDALKDYLYRTAELRLWKSADPAQLSRPGESEQDFRLRTSQAARELRDTNSEKLRAVYAPKLMALQEKIRKAQQKVEKEQSQASQQKFQAFISIGSSVLAALTGRKLASAANVNRAASAARAAGRIGRETQDVTQATDNVEQLQEQFAELEAKCRAEIEDQQGTLSPDKLQLEEVVVKPKKADIAVTQVALVWLPPGEFSE